MKPAYLTICLLIFLGLNNLFAQELPELTAKDSLVTSSWMLGVGFNIVDDSGDAFRDFTTVRNQWNAVPFPSRLSIGRYFRSGIGLEAIGTYNVYKEGNTVDNQVNPEDKPYYGFDGRISYDLNKIFGQTGFFDPYAGIGAGYSHANDIGRGTYNAVLGFRIWFSEHWGMDLNTSGKWSMGNEASNHIQHAAGVVYQFEIEKGLTKKGEEKKELLEEIASETKKYEDSLAAAKNAEAEAKALAERLEREKEEARLAAEKARAEERKNSIREAIDGIGPVYFDFNSSYLNSDAKNKLAELADLLIANDSVSLQISAHADSRGSERYNLWLSERRAQRTKSFLVEKGVPDERLPTSSNGEENLANHCRDGVRCSEAEHKENRRAEFTIVKF